MNESIIGNPNQFIRNVTNSIIKNKFETDLGDIDRAFGEMFAQTQIFQLYIESLKEKYSDYNNNYENY
jgi:hypothetical protein